MTTTTLPLIGLGGRSPGMITLSEEDYASIFETRPRLHLGYHIGPADGGEAILAFSLIIPPAEERITVANRAGKVVGNVPTHTDVYVAAVIPEYEGNGEADVLGVFETRVEAEACCYRKIKSEGTHVNAVVFDCQLGKAKET